MNALETVQKEPRRARVKSGQVPVSEFTGIEALRFCCRPSGHYMNLHHNDLIGVEGQRDVLSHVKKAVV